MQYYSTNKESPPVLLEEAVLRGLAPDGGLYFPAEFPRFTGEELNDLTKSQALLMGGQGDDSSLGFLQEVGFRVLHKWFGEDIETETLRQIARSAQNFPIPLRSVGPFRVMELFHGPTMAFKDVAARHLARLMNHFLEQRHERAILLVATSGDTGGAIADGFAGLENIQVVVLFPEGKVSRLQEEQLTRVADNVTPVEVQGVFDDCQAMVKAAFRSPALADLNLTSANSINIARLIPQIIYYVYTWFVLQRRPLEICVPSGNFGNLTAALFARQMGVPVDRFIAATNENDAPVRYFESGFFRPRATVQTLSTAMDVGHPSNFARVLELFSRSEMLDEGVLRAYKVSDEQTVQTIRRVYERYGYLLCPHSAVAWQVAELHGDPDFQQVVVATASPQKFARELYAATGIQAPETIEMGLLRRREARKITISARLEALIEVLRALP